MFSCTTTPSLGLKLNNTMKTSKCNARVVLSLNLAPKTTFIWTKSGLWLYCSTTKMLNVSLLNLPTNFSRPQSNQCPSCLLQSIKLLWRMYAYIAFSTIQKKVKLYAALSSSSFHTPLIGLILDRKLNLCPNNAKFSSRPLPKKH